MLENLKQKGYRALKKSEKYTKTDMIYLTKGGSWLSIGKVIGIGSSLATTIALANLIPPDTYGIYRFVLSLAAIVGIFTLTGMGTAVTQAVSRGYEGALRAGFVAKLKWSIGVTLASFIGAAYYFINDNATLALSLVIVGILSPLKDSFVLYRTYLVGKKAFKTAVIYNSIQAPITAGAFIVTLFFTDDVILIILAYFVINTIAVGILYALTLYSQKPRENTDTDTLNYSKHLSVMNVIGRIAGQLDSILLFHFLGAAPLAAYSIAKAPAKKLREVTNVLQSLAFPKLAQRDLHTLKQSIPKKALQILGVGASLFAAYFFAAPYLFMFLFPQYTDAVLYSQVLAVSILFLPLFLYKQTFIAHKRRRELYIMQTVIPIVRIIALAILLPIYGIWGAIVALLLTRTVNAILLLYLFSHLED